MESFCLNLRKYLQLLEPFPFDVIEEEIAEVIFYRILSWKSFNFKFIFSTGLTGRTDRTGLVKIFLTSFINNKVQRYNRSTIAAELYYELGNSNARSRLLCNRYKHLVPAHSIR